jgi:hypothetical protein
MDQEPIDLVMRMRAAVGASQARRADVREQVRRARSSPERMGRTGERMHRQLDLGGYRLHITEEPGRSLVEVHELQDGQWRLTAGPYIYPGPMQPGLGAEDVEIGLRQSIDWPPEADE